MALLSFYGGISLGKFYLPTTNSIAMVDEYKRTVNTSNDPIKEGDEVMIPYSRVVYIEWDKDLGARLQAMRNAQGLSQPQLADLTQGMVSEGMVQSLELGRKGSVSRKKLDSLLKVLGCDIRSLFPTVTVKNI